MSKSKVIIIAIKTLIFNRCNDYLLNESVLFRHAYLFFFAFEESDWRNPDSGMLDRNFPLSIHGIVL